MTQYNATGASIAASKPKGEGFFQVNLDRLTDIVRHDLPSECLYAQVVLAGGVNGHLAEARTSTHGSKSVNERTFMGKSAADEAIKKLCAAGFLEHMPEAKHRTDPRWYVDRHFTPDVAVSQKFLEPQKRGLREKWVKGRGRLSDLYCGARASPDISANRARSDALLLFFHLQKNQNFGQFGGVNPSCAATLFSPASAINGDGIDHVLEAAHEDWSLVNEMEPRDRPPLSAKFLESALPEVPDWSDAPSLENRGKHAMQVLHDAGLIYDAFVVWPSDPLVDISGRHEPHYTLYLRGAWTDILETHLQHEINNAVIQSGTRSGVDVYSASRGATADWHGSGRHSYFLPDAYVKKAVLLKQLRVRWWPHSGDTIDSLNRDRQRIEQWGDDIASSMSCSLSHPRYVHNPVPWRPSP
ncbi:MAG: hypothetical protein V4684_09615 [Pseudomonadota bacterium]